MKLLYICVIPFKLMSIGTYCVLLHRGLPGLEASPSSNFIVVIYQRLRTTHTTGWRFRWWFSSVLQEMWSTLIAHFFFVRRYHEIWTNVYEKLSIIRHCCQRNGALLDTPLERRSTVTSSCLLCWSAVKFRIGGRKDSPFHNYICYFTKN